MRAAPFALSTATALLLLAPSGASAYWPIRAASGAAEMLNNMTNDLTSLDLTKMDSEVLVDKLNKFSMATSQS